MKETYHLSIRLPKKVRQDLYEMAEGQNRSINGMINAIILDEIKKWKRRRKNEDSAIKTDHKKF